MRPKKIYVCEDTTAADIIYDASTGQSVQAAIDAMKKELEEKVKDKNFVFMQNEPAVAWYICHNLRKKPSVFVEDMYGNDLECDIQYVDENNIVLTFDGGAVAGRAVMN